jgi:hypothetical protein
MVPPPPLHQICKALLFAFISCDAVCRYITSGSLTNPLQKEVTPQPLGGGGGRGGGGAGGRGGGGGRGPPCSHVTPAAGLLDRALLLAHVDAGAAPAAVRAGGRHRDPRRSACLRRKADHAVGSPLAPACSKIFTGCVLQKHYCDALACRYEDGNREHKVTKEVMVSFERVRLSIR